VALSLCISLAWESPAVATTPAPSRVTGARHDGLGIKRFFRGLRLKAMRTWKSWNRRPTRAQALAPLQRMIRSGRIGGSDLRRVRALYPELGPKIPPPTIRSSRDDPRMKPLYRMLDSGRISEADFIRAERAHGIQ
jgi:hypothetical protein